ncbi:MAG: hypothetical protein ACR2IH_13780 [Pyrinomonadaceae bacterium]
MRRLRNIVSVYAAVGLLVIGLGGLAEAQQRDTRQVRDTVRSLNSRIDDFGYTLDGDSRSGSISRQDSDQLRRSVRELQDKVNAFDDNLSQQRENRDDVNAILAAARPVDSYFRRGSMAARDVQSAWTAVRELVNKLASSYGVTPDWNGTGRTYPAPSTSRYPDSGSYPPAAASGSASYGNGLTGTYQLDPARSENINDIVTSSNVSGANRQDLESKLEAPEKIAIDIRGTQVTLASSKAAPVTFVADGREKTEQSGTRTFRLRATLRGQELVVSSLGGDTDYTVTFSPTDSGRGMKVTRRITTDYLSETILAESLYSKNESVARLGIDTSSPSDSGVSGTYSSNDPDDRAGNNGQGPVLRQSRIGQYIVPNGTSVTAVLDNNIDTKVSQNNDRFRMIVQSPDEFRGAVVEGRLSGVGRSGQVSGHSNVTFNFDRITLRNGQTYDFSGTLLSMKDQFGKEVRVDSEGTAKGQSQTKETAKRGGIGAGLGAIIGAIAGGGTGAAVGAIIGGGVGAGSVVVQGRDNIELMKGSTVVLQSSSPLKRDRPISEN